MKKLYIVRHGKTMFNAMDKIQGVADSPLIESGIKELMVIGENFNKRNWKINKTFHSSASRTRQTLEILKSKLNISHLPSIEAQNIEEWNFGSFEGADGGKNIFINLLPYVANKNSLNELSCDEIANIFHEIDTLKIVPKWEELENRILNGFKSIARYHLNNNESALVVSHGMTMLALYKSLTNIDLYPGSIKNGGLLELTYNDERDSFSVVNLELEIK